MPGLLLLVALLALLMSASGADAEKNSG